jgi:N-acetylmuramoyl-L-alanine amidase
MKLVVLFFLIFININSYALTVLIDPGHGGDELGAIGKLNGKEIYEKDLALNLALKIKEKIKDKVDVYLTRTIDTHVDLQKRADIAELLKADLFISIHFNSSTEIHSHGFETYYLDNSADAAVKKVESIENQNKIGVEKTINQILIDLIIQKTVDTSSKLARLIHLETDKKIRGQYKRKNRGLKKGLFYVLALSKRPGVLIEAGFISNTKELAVISTEKYLESYAEAVAQGILKSKF